MTSSSLVFLLAALTAVNLHPYEAVEPHMGTLFRIKLYARDEAQAQRAFQAAFARVAALDHTLSDYSADSELSRLSKIAVNHPVHVSDDLYRVLASSQTLSRESDGAFDMTVGPLTHMWRAARRQNRLPDPDAIAQAKAKCGYRHLHLNRSRHTAEFDQPGMQLDAGAIAKGYAADEALRALTNFGITSALVAASGDLAFSNAPPGEPGWKIGIDSLDSANAPFTRVLRLSNGAVSTSGSSEQHLDVGGHRYSHIIDPKTGMGITRDLTVTLVARRGIDADSISTAVDVLGTKRGLALVKHHAGASAMIVENDNGHLRYFETRRLR
jgi:thiamine biosynthesis lipoprotein